MYNTSPFFVDRLRQKNLISFGFHFKRLAKFMEVYFLAIETCIVCFTAKSCEFIQVQ